MKVIGLTGGIGSGKSTVTEYLRDKGYMVIDADVMARQITQRGTDTLMEIVKCLGENILLSDGNLDRKKVASIIFNDHKKKQEYEKLTTEVVVNQIKDKVISLREENRYDILFVDAPLLFEVGLDKITDMVWLIVADEEMRIARVTARDQVSSDEVKVRIRHQMNAREQAEKSHEIIDNSKGKEDLYLQLDGLINKYAGY